MAYVWYVAQVFGDRNKPDMVRDVSFLRSTSIQAFLSDAAIIYFRLFSQEVIQAYLQTGYRMTRNAHVTPKLFDRPIFGIEDGEVLKLFIPLYRICRKGGYRCLILDKQNDNDLGMLLSPGDQALYVKKSTPG